MFAAAVSSRGSIFLSIATHWAPGPGRTISGGVAIGVSVLTESDGGSGGAIVCCSEWITVAAGGLLGVLAEGSKAFCTEAAPESVYFRLFRCPVDITIKPRTTKHTASPATTSPRRCRGPSGGDKTGSSRNKSSLEEAKVEEMNFSKSGGGPSLREISWECSNGLGSLGWKIVCIRSEESFFWSAIAAAECSSGWLGSVGIGAGNEVAKTAGV